VDHRTIEIDFDVHKCLEAERASFSETTNEVLRRLLGIGEIPARPSVAPVATGRAWTGKGVTLPTGTEVRMKYNGRAVAGVIVDGKWLVEGQEFSSPSSAASALCVTKAGRKTSLDGWKYWEAKRPGHDGWIEIESLRPEVMRRRAALINSI
jgi:hypothetical protein